MEKVYAVYILTNRYNRVLYTGVTSDLRARMYQHREKLMPGFTSRYNVTKLVISKPVMMRWVRSPVKNRSKPAHAAKRSTSLILSIQNGVIYARSYSSIEIASSPRSSQ